MRLSAILRKRILGVTYQRAMRSPSAKAVSKA
jgi:hypothetical protein